MTRERCRRVAFSVVAATTFAACTGSDDDRATPPTEPDIGANVVPIPPAPVATPAPVEPAPDSRPVEQPVEPVFAVDLTGEIPAADGSVVDGEPSVVEVAGVPLTDVAISPSGDRIAANRGTEICIIETVVGTSDPSDGCVEFPAGVADGSMNWSPDESQLAFHHDFFRMQAEPDIVVLDTTTSLLEVVTDDDTDVPELGPVDLAPFYDDTGTLHFFRLDDVPSAHLLVAGDGGIAPVEGIRVVPFAVAAERDPATGRIAITVPAAGISPDVRSIDLSDRTVAPGGSGLPLLSQVRGGRAVTVPFDTGAPDAPIAALVDLESAVPARLIPADIDGDRSVTGVGLAPDGSSIVVIIEDRADPSGHQLVVLPMLDDGSIGAPGVVASGPEFAPNGGDTRIRPHGLGTRNQIAWSDGQMIFGLGPDRIVTLTLAATP